MDRVKLGLSGIEVSRICLGCMSFGKAGTMHDWTLDSAQSAEMVGRALDLGINFFDTANVYSAGTSEEYLGAALKSVPRDKVVIGTKVYFNEGALSREAISREIEGSLRRLGTDYIDLYIIHRYDYETPIAETMEALHKLVESGKVRALGASAMYGYQFYEMQNVARENGWTPFSTMQNHYNLLYREDERELIPICERTNVSRTPYSPLAAGRLSRKEWTTNTKRSQTDKIAVGKYDTTEEQDKTIVQRVFELSEKYDVTMTQIALAWHFAKGVAAPIIGATKNEYLADAAAAVDLKLTREDVDYLEELYVPHKIMGAVTKNPVWNSVLNK
ncbi:MAG: aldo/keto reductase [Thermoguttaceae bacterium]|nr:aldo/keto reductase [Thermoguttaceae bacterium]